MTDRTRLRSRRVVAVVSALTLLSGCTVLTASQGQVKKDSPFSSFCQWPCITTLQQTGPLGMQPVDLPDTQEGRDGLQDGFNAITNP